MSSSDALKDLVVTLNQKASSYHEKAMEEGSLGSKALSTSLAALGAATLVAGPIGWLIAGVAAAGGAVGAAKLFKKINDDQLSDWLKLSAKSIETTYDSEKLLQHIESLRSRIVEMELAKSEAREIISKADNSKAELERVST